MESKAWSDQESDNDESKDADRSRERRPPVLPLGTIYERETPRDPEPVEREHERTEPEVAQSIIPGIPELSLAAPRPDQAAPSAGEQFQLQQQAAESVANTSEEDDDDEEAKEEDQQPPTARSIVAPLPVAVAEDTPPSLQAVLDPTVSRAIEPEVPPEPIIPPEIPRRPVPVAVAETPIETPEPVAPVEAQVPFVYPPVQPIERPAPILQPPEEQPPVYAAATGGGGNRPPTPPGPPEGPATPDYPPAPEQRWPDEGSSAYAATMAQPGLRSYNTSPNTYGAQQYGGDAITKRQFERYQADDRRKHAALLITSLAIGWYLGHRKVKPLREQVQQLQKENTLQGDRVTMLEGQQRTAQSTIERQGSQLRQVNPYEQPYAPGQPAAAPQPRFETAAGVPALQTSAELPKRPEQPLPAEQSPQERVPRIIGGDGQEIVLQEGQHFEKSAGGYGMVLDEHNHVVQDAIEYGESFQQDRLPERMPTPFGTQDARFKDSGGIFVGGGGGPVGVPQATLSSGQVPQDHTLSAGPAAGHSPNEEAQHLLEAPKANPVVSTITSPWLWLAVGVLMIAFFAAATI